jgi:hypothetical protein
VHGSAVANREIDVNGGTGFEPSLFPPWFSVTGDGQIAETLPLTTGTMYQLICPECHASLRAPTLFFQRRCRLVKPALKPVGGI